MKAEFASYSIAYRHVVMRREDGIVEIRFHSDGGPLVWGDSPHSELGHCFADLADDPEIRVVVLTGTGDEFIARLDDSWVGPMTPAKWDRIHRHGRRLLQNLLDIDVPVVAAVNGPAKVHAELAVLADVVVAADTAYFQDAPHFRYGTVPGDGVQAVWPLLLGMNRGRYFLLTGQRLSAEEALALGVVGEVVPAGEVLDRAWAIARDLARQPLTTLRYTRAVLVQPLKERLLATVGPGLAYEGLGAYESWPTG